MLRCGLHLNYVRVMQSESQKQPLKNSWGRGGGDPASNFCMCVGNRADSQKTIQATYMIFVWCEKIKKFDKCNMYVLLLSLVYYLRPSDGSVKYVCIFRKIHPYLEHCISPEGEGSKKEIGQTN